MQSLHYLDLAKTLADAHLEKNDVWSADTIERPVKRQHAARERICHALISLGERLAPTDIQLKVSTGPPCK